MISSSKCNPFRIVDRSTSWRPKLSATISFSGNDGGDRVKTKMSSFFDAEKQTSNNADGSSTKDDCTTSCGGSFHGENKIATSTRKIDEDNVSTYDDEDDGQLCMEDIDNILTELEDEALIAPVDITAVEPSPLTEATATSPTDIDDILTKLEVNALIS